MPAGLDIHHEIRWVPQGLPLIENICCCCCNICIGTSTTRLSEGVSGPQYFGIGIPSLKYFLSTKSICSGSSVYSWFQSLILSLTQKGSAPHFHMLLLGLHHVHNKNSVSGTHSNL